MELSDYEKKRLERIKKNEEYFKKLGLDKFRLGGGKNLKRKKSQSEPAKKRTKTIPITPRRRSTRLSPTSTKVTPPTPINDDVVHPAKSTYRRAARRNIEESWRLSKEEKNVLSEGIDENFLSKFEFFLQYHDKISEQNIRNVMKQVRKLAAGDGIRYESRQYGWPENCYFRRGEKITPLSDIVELMEEGQECENKWGRDHGNGWLLSHPLKKLLLFQQFALENPSFLNPKIKDEEKSENKEDQKVETLEAKVKKKDSSLIGTEVTKRFGNEVYVGTIDRFSSDKMLWHVTYNDGDKEEFDEEDLKKAKISNDKLIL